MRILPFLFEHAEWRDLFWSPITVSEVCVVCVHCSCVKAGFHKAASCLRYCLSQSSL